MQKLIKQSYYAALSYIDDLIGDIVKAFQLRSEYENTIIVVTGDHGKYRQFDGHCLTSCRI